MTARRRARVALTALVALVAVGCGRSDDPEEVTTVREIDLLAETSEAGTFRMTLVAEEVVDDDAGVVTRGTTEMAGVVDPATGAFDFEGRFEEVHEAPEGAVDDLDLGQRVDMAMRSDGTSRWVRMGTDGSGTWLDWSEDEDDEGLEVDEDADWLSGDLMLDPMAYLARIREQATTFTEVGRDEVAGVATTRYRATVEGDGTQTVDLWLDDDDRPRRVEADEVTMELTDYGVPVEVVVPDDVGDEEEDFLALVAAFGPRVTGDWTLLARGAVAGQGWEVYEVDAVVGEVATHCWTFELEDAEPDPSFAEMEPGLGFLDAFPAHDGHDATCPGGVRGGGRSSDPALTPVGGSLFSFEPGAAGLRVSDRFADAPVELVLDDGEVVELPLTGGVAVWDAGTIAPGTEVVEVLLADGSVSCPVDGADGAIYDVGLCVRT